MSDFRIESRIELDAGHRVPDHGSKCRSLHGHRYVVVATLQAPQLVEDGASEAGGMVMDFGVLKRMMMEVIHEPFDHALILWERDTLLGVPGFVNAMMVESQKVAMVPCVPTAENLARHWYQILDRALNLWWKELGELELGLVPPGVRLVQVKVWETPNHSAEYPC